MPKMHTLKHLRSVIDYRGFRLERDFISLCFKISSIPRVRTGPQATHGEKEHEKILVYLV